MEELQRMRERAGLNQSELSRKSGVNRSTINKIERGKHTPGLQTLEKLAVALDAEISDFFPKGQAPLPLEMDGGRGLQLWRQHASNLAEELEELARGAEDEKYDRRMGRYEGAEPAASGAIAVIEILLGLIEAGDIPASREEMKSLLREGYRLARAADRIEELAAPSERDIMRGLEQSKEETLERARTAVRFSQIVRNLDLTAKEREEILV